MERRHTEDELSLKALLDERPLADDGFSAVVLARVQRHVWVRRALLATAGLLSSAVIAAVLVTSGFSGATGVQFQPWQVFVVLVAVGTAGAMWLDTEALGLPGGLK